MTSLHHRFTLYPLPVAVPQGIEKCSKRNGDMYWLHYGPVRPGAADLSGPRVPQASR